MNIFGMGPLELLVIALIAFILLGPQRMVDAARLLGKTTKEVRRLTDELPKIVLEEEQDQSAQAKASPPVPSSGDPEAGQGKDESDGEEAADEGPVAFRSVRTGTDGGKPENTQSRDT